MKSSQFLLCLPWISAAVCFTVPYRQSAGCSYLVQINNGKEAERSHYEYIDAQPSLKNAIKEKWQIGQTFQGYHLDFCEHSHSQGTINDHMRILESAPQVRSIEEDQEVTQTGWIDSNDLQELDEEQKAIQEEESSQEDSNLKICGQQANTVACQTDAPWSLHRVGYQKVQLPLPTGDMGQTFPYVYEPTDRPNVYIMDTEVFVANKQYAGRAEQVKSYVSLNESSLPFPPHGSHVAGIVGAARYGVCKWCRLLSVVTLGRTGTGSWSNVLNGATWIAQDAAARNSTVPAVVNLSLSGSKSEIINAAVDAMVDAGLIVVVAVGNSKIDACQQSPASATKPVKVGGSDNGDKFATFSNWGKCLDIIAPGALIRSTGPYNKELTMSGTSMSAPIVAGIIASALAHGDLSPAKARDNYQLKYYLNTRGIQGAIKDIPDGTNNLLAQVSYDAPSQCSKFQESESVATSRRMIFQYE